MWQTRRSVLLQCGLVVLIGLTTCVVTVARNDYKNVDYCLTKNCIKTANQYLQSMNDSADPCENFYDFVCGNWKDEYPEYIDIMGMLNQKVLIKYNDIIKENITSNDSLSVKKVKTLYAACINETERNKVGLRPMFDYLAKVGLPRYPRLLNLTGCLNKTDDRAEKPFDWIQTVASIKRHVYQGIFVDITLMVDPLNSTRYVLNVQPTANLEVNSFSDQKSFKPNTAKNRLFFCDTISLILHGQNETGCFNETCNTSACSLASDIVHNITNKHKEISGILQKSFNWNDNLTESYQMFDNVFELQKHIYRNVTSENKRPPIFERLLQTLFANMTDYPLNLASERIICLRKNILYLQTMIDYLVQQPVEHLELYLWWNAVLSVAPETTKELYTNFFPTLSMEKHCASFIFSLATPVFAAEKNKNQDYGRVHDMIKQLKKEFVLMLEASQWLGEDTKRQAVAKIEAIDHFVGGPQMKDLDVIYAGLNVTNTTHISNIFRFFEMEIRRRIGNFKSKYNMLTDIYSSLHSVNAFYFMQSNAVVLPEVTLKNPLYNLGLNYLDYGAIGSIIAHEVSHSLDPRSRQFDAKGNLRQWWDERSLDEYSKRVDCLVKQYDKFEMTKIGQNVNGSKTLQENFSDNVGLSLVYRLFEKSLNQTGNQVLPGLAKYTPQQMFFISYGSLCCTTETKEFLNWHLKDEHSPMRYRLLAPLRNLPEFASAFECPKGTYMNGDEERCSMFTT